MKTIFSYCKFLLVTVSLLCISESKASSDLFPRFRSYPHLLHAENHFFRIRNMLFGLFGVSVIALGAYFLYRYLKWRSDANQFEQTGGVFNERGALLPLHQEVSSPPTFFQAIQSSWPFNTRLFVHQPGRVIHAVNVDSHHHVPTDFCNPEDLRKDNYKPWERL